VVSQRGNELASSFSDVFSVLPVITLTGPRQSGKTTVVYDGTQENRIDFARIACSFQAIIVTLHHEYFCSETINRFAL
jgi:predicted AAA+ superfamily ATPase